MFIQGFISVYSKDIYQLRLSNVYFSKSGASGIRIALLMISANSEKITSAQSIKILGKTKNLRLSLRRPKRIWPERICEMSGRGQENDPRGLRR